MLHTPEEYAERVLCPDNTDAPFYEPESEEEKARFIENVVQRLSRVVPPPELQELHEAYIAFVASTRLAVDGYFRSDNPDALQALSDAYLALDPDLFDRIYRYCEPRETIMRERMEEHFGTGGG